MQAKESQIERERELYGNSQESQANSSGKSKHRKEPFDERLLLFIEKDERTRNTRDWSQEDAKSGQEKDSRPSSHRSPPCPLPQPPPAERTVCNPSLNV